MSGDSATCRIFTEHELLAVGGFDPLVEEFDSGQPDTDQRKSPVPNKTRSRQRKYQRIGDDADQPAVR